MMEQSGVKISKKRAGDSLEDSGSPPVPGPPLQRPPLQRLPVQLAATVFTVLAATALIAVAAGCGPSVDAVVKMRETLPPATGTRGTVGANLVFA
ncbi:MAG TPA: hypothetical protein VM223_13210, partial [Planctomycetota bacterium]|nr:hypothetical protein [Planctomycetota bacterium]